MKTYNMYYTASRTNVTLHLDSSSSSPPVYYGSTSLMTTSPNIKLHQGRNSSGPVVSVAKFRWTSRHLQLGLPSGSQADQAASKGDQAMVWDDMAREKNVLRCSDYVLSTAAGSDLGKKREFRWQKEDEKLATNVYRCVDDEGQVVGSMLSGGFFNWKKGGEIEMDEKLAKELEELLIVGALGIWAAEAFGSARKGYGGERKESSA